MFAIIRMNEKKFCNAGEITNAVEHNLRIGNLPENVDSIRVKENVVLLDQFKIDGEPAGTFQQELMKSYKEKDITVRQNNVLCLEWVLTASPEFFKNKSKKEVLDWAKDQLNYLKEEFGDAVKHVVLHLDESTPHLHVLASPEENKIYKSTNVYKDGTKKTTEKMKWGLNAKRFNEVRLSKIQDNYSEFNKKYGLKRGDKNSKAVHEPLKDLREKDKKALLDLLEFPKDYLDRLYKKEKKGEKVDWRKTLDEAFIRVHQLKKRLKAVLNLEKKEARIKELEEKKQKLEEIIDSKNSYIKMVEREALQNTDIRNENKRLSAIILSDGLTAKEKLEQQKKTVRENPISNSTPSGAGGYKKPKMSA